MRSVRLSATFGGQLEELLAQGEPKFGAAVVEAKKQLVRAAIVNHLAAFPGTGRLEPEHGLYIWSVRRTPFVLLYDFDDAEIRVQMVVHKHSDRSGIDPASVE